MAVGAERSLFAADQRDFCRKISGNVPPRQRKFGKLFCGEQGEKDAAGFSFFLLLYKRKNRVSAARKQVRRQGRRGGERARTAGGGDNENAKVTTRKKVGAGKSRAAGRQKGFKEKIGKESAFGGAEKRKKRREKTGVRRKREKGGKTGILRKARAAGG